MGQRIQQKVRHCLCVTKVEWPLSPLVFIQPQRRFVQAVCLYQPGTTVLLSEDDSPNSPGQQSNFQVPFSIVADTEHSANSEGSHETGDSGRFSHESNDEIHLSSVISTTPPTSGSFVGSDSGVNVNPVLSNCREPPVPLATDHSPTSSLQKQSTAQNWHTHPDSHARHPCCVCLFEGQWTGSQSLLWEAWQPIRWSHISGECVLVLFVFFLNSLILNVQWVTMWKDSEDFWPE